MPVQVLPESGSTTALYLLSYRLIKGGATALHHLSYRLIKGGATARSGGIAVQYKRV